MKKGSIKESFSRRRAIRTNSYRREKSVQETGWELRTIKPRKQPWGKAQKSILKGHDVGWPAHCLVRLECTKRVEKGQVTAE